MRRLILPILILAVAVIVVLFIARGDKEPPAPVAVKPGLAPPVVVQEPPAPRIRRIDPPVVEEPLPPLNQSDTEIWTAASEAFGSPMIDSLLVRSGVIRKIVVTIDNAPRDKIAMRVRAAHATPGRFAVTGEEGDYALSEENFARYRNLVAWVDGVDTGKAVSLYQRYYPLFQQAYEELGYPGQEFNARVIEVIDDFLTAPAPASPIPLARPHVLYQYADPDLEGRSAGQKALIRMGSSNAAVIKAKLRQFRAEIIERSQ